MKPLLRILRYLRPYRSLAVLTLLCAACATGFELLPPWAIKIIIDDVIQAKQAALLPGALGLLVGAYVLKNVFASLRIRFNNQLEQAVMHDLRNGVFGALQGLSLNYYEQRSTGEIMSRVMNDTEQVERIFIDGLESVLTAGLTLVGITAMLFVINWQLAVLSLVPVPFLVLAASWFTKRVHGHYRDIRKRSADLSGYLQDALSGIRETMGFVRHWHEQERFDRLSRDYRGANLKAMVLWSMYSPGMILLAGLGTVLILWFGAGEVLAGRLTVGELVLFLSYLALFYVPINQIHSVNHMLQHALAASDRVFDVLDAVPEVADKPGVVAPIHRLCGAVRFEDVYFYYRPEVPVLTGVTVSISAGERVALVGPSGAGKSTLLKLLMRFYDVQMGAVMIDGRDVRDFPQGYLRQQIGFVQQEPFLFNGTIRENILYGDLGADRIRLESATRAARAHEFIEALPEGYDTWIGERGVKLSVGQKQRVSIARALLKDPPIVICDEATSNIDTETELKIREALAELTRGRTTFVVAHRLSTLHDADRILVIDRGRLVEDGRHDDLLRHGGLYAGLYEAQFQI